MGLVYKIRKASEPPLVIDPHTGEEITDATAAAIAKNSHPKSTTADAVDLLSNALAAARASRNLTNKLP